MKSYELEDVGVLPAPVDDQYHGLRPERFVEASRAGLPSGATILLQRTATCPLPCIICIKLANGKPLMSENPNVFDGSRVSGYASSASVEIDERRPQVLTLRLRRLSQTQIARALNVDQSTVSRDLQWIAQHWRERYGVPAGLEPTEEIGEAIAVFDDVEGAAWRDYHRLNLDQAKQRNACLRTVILARQMRANLLLNLGFLDRRIGNIGGTLRADTIRQALRDQGLLVTDGGHITVEEDEEDDGRATARQAG